MPNQIRTLLRHERAMEAPRKDRGARHWSAAQVLTSTWYFVECCKDYELDLQRWVTTSIEEATDIHRSLGTSRWVRIYICLRAPMSIQEATLFEEIDEAYQVGASGSYLFQLANGLAYVVGAETVREVCSKPLELELVYNRKNR